MRLFKILMAIILVANLMVACSPPTCPKALVALPASAPSAGCLVKRDGMLLVVQGLNNKLSVPGGSSNTNESPQCTAHRETWEETGLDVRPRQLIAVFDTGFHLYFCKLHGQSGSIDPPFRLEVQQAFWLAPQDFQQYQWRYSGQQSLLAEWLAEIQ